MTIPEKCSPALWPPTSILSDTNYQQSDRALDESEDQWVNDFIKRLDCAIEDIDRNKSVLSVPRLSRLHSKFWY